MPIKNIAVPTRRVRAVRAADRKPPSYSPVTLKAAAPVRRPLPGHRFAVGEHLAMAQGGRDISRPASYCEVIALLPSEGRPLRYRVRSENETFERIVDEIDLARPVTGLE